MILFYTCMVIWAVTEGQIVTQNGTGGGGGAPTFPHFPHVPHAPEAIHHIGSGYNMLTGNPDGEFWSTGGEDPGVSLTRKIFTISPGDHPQEIIDEHHDGCQYSHGYSLFHSTMSYQDKLLTNVKSSGTADNGLRPYAFTLSSGYQAVATQTSKHHYVFQDAATYCSLGHVRYSMNLAVVDKYPVTREFATGVCALPATYDKAKYMQFIDDWGTHVMTEVTIGKATTNRFVAPISYLFNYVMFNVTSEISMGGPLYGYPESYVIDLNSYKYKHEYKYIVGTFEDTLSIGDTYTNDIIAKSVQTLDSALDSKYWQYMNYYVNTSLCKTGAAGNLATWQSNIVKALGDYPAFKQASKPAVTPLAMPVTWPLGSYSLPKPTSGCPTGFMEGSIMLKQYPNSAPHTSALNLDGTYSAPTYTMNYCTKEDPKPSQYDIYWPKGDYCIQQYDDRCPYAFKLGTMKLRVPLATTKSGIVPWFDTPDIHTTVMHFCCRNDTVYTHSIYLPNDKPFYLLRNQHGCQHVVGMTATEQTLSLYNDVTNNGPADQTYLEYSYPYIVAYGHTAHGDRQYTLHYCYYSAIQK